MIEKDILRSGNLITRGVRLELHEKETVKLLVELGKEVVLIPPSNTPGRKRPDFEMDGMEWEMKSPIAGSRLTVRRMVCGALLQSENIVLDLRRIKRGEDIALKELEDCFKKFRKVRRMIVIRKSGEFLTWRKK